MPHPCNLHMALLSDWAPWLLRVLSVQKHSKQAARKQMGGLTNSKNMLNAAVNATCSKRNLEWMERAVNAS